jgi:predicted transcriptional regulator of viral defense system
MPARKELRNPLREVGGIERYERMRRMGCLTRQDLEEIAGSRQALPTLLVDYQRKGIIDRIRRNLYAVLDMESERPVLSRYQIGSRLFSDACISHRSAFEALGYADGPSNDVYVVTKSRFTDFKYNGVFYRHVDKRVEISAEWVDGARVTTLEQTIVDSIHNFEKIVGLEEVVRCILRAPRPDAEKLLLCLERYGNGFLYQKCGYVLEQLQEYVDLPKSFYRECREHCPSTVRYMAKEAGGLVYSRGWGIYAPELRKVNK